MKRECIAWDRLELNLREDRSWRPATLGGDSRGQGSGCEPKSDKRRGGRGEAMFFFELEAKELLRNTLPAVMAFLSLRLS
jgi:hypothetical protein